MAKDSKNTGFQSSAGLIRYFDQEEKNAIKLDPRLVAGLCFGFAIFIALLPTIVG